MSATVPTLRKCFQTLLQTLFSNFPARSSLRRLPDERDRFSPDVSDTDRTKLGPILRSSSLKSRRLLLFPTKVTLDYVHYNMYK